MDLCNGIVKEGYVPEDWKSSVVYYQFAKGNRIQWCVDLTEELNCWNMLGKWWNERIFEQIIWQQIDIDDMQFE